MLKERKMLRKQIELLAKRSADADETELVRLASAMADVYRELVGHALLRAVFLIVAADLFVHFIVLIKNFCGS